MISPRWCRKCLLVHCLVLQDIGPEFIRMSEEPQVVLELPGSIVVSPQKNDQNPGIINRYIHEVLTEYNEDEKCFKTTD